MALLVAGLVAAPAAAGDRTDVPLRNWGGFAVFRDALYDDLERLVAAGLAGPSVLNTRPLTRTEAARVVARAIERIRRDDEGRYNGRRDLEPVVDRLIAELGPELAALGVRLNGDPAAPPSWFSFIPVDRAQVGLGLVSRDLKPINAQGLRLREVFNAGATFETRAQLGDVLTVYLQPEGLGYEDDGQLRLAQAYAKLTLFNVELAVGRESLWWGPALHGSLSLSNNGPPLDHVRIGSAEPFELPWIGRWLGPAKALFFVAQLEENRDHPRAKLAGMRASIAPADFLELGASRLTVFDGEDGPGLSAVDVLRILFDPPAGDPGTPGRLRSNNVFAIDGELRVARADRYWVPARDLRLYGELGWDDTCCQTAFVPLADAMSGLVGVHLLGLFGREGLESRFEYVRTSRLSFRHSQFTDGFASRGHVLSHFVGTEGEEFYSRVTNRLTERLLLGLELSRAVVGPVERGPLTPKERSVAGGVDLSYRISKRYTLFAQYRLARVDNRNFDPTDDGFDHLFRFELTGSFR